VEGLRGMEGDLRRECVRWSEDVVGRSCTWEVRESDAGSYKCFDIHGKLKGVLSGVSAGYKLQPMLSPHCGSGRCG